MMNVEELDNLTSAEAGFLYAAVRTGHHDGERWEIDEVAAGPLVRVVEAGVKDGEDVEKALCKAGVGGWWARTQHGVSSRYEAIGVAMQRLTDEEALPLHRHRARRTIERFVAELGGDVSPLSSACFDLRRIFQGEGRDGDHVTRILVVVGAVLMASIDRISVRRKLAGMTRNLSPTLATLVGEAIEEFPSIETEAQRRIYEVYCRIWGRDDDAETALATLGLYFGVSGAVFRQNAVVERLYRAVPERLQQRCRQFRQARMRSQNPQMSPAVADLLESIVSTICPGPTDE